MSLTLYYHHPLASFCHKVLIALYENKTPFAAEIVDLGNAEASARFLDLRPMRATPSRPPTACSSDGWPTGCLEI